MLQMLETLRRAFLTRKYASPFPPHIHMNKIYVWELILLIISELPKKFSIFAGEKETA